MEELKELALYRILKLELKLLLEDITEALDKYDLVALRLQDIYDVLKMQEDKMQIISIPYGKHPLTEKITQLHKQRVKCAALIYMQIRSLERSNCQKTQHNVALAKSLAKPHLAYLGQKRHHTVSMRVSSFIDALGNDFYTDERNAFTSLGLQPHLNELEIINKEYEDLSSQRYIDILNRPPTGDPDLEDETKRLLQTFFGQVSSYQKTFTEVDYEPLIMLLNTILTEYSKSIKTRLATNKRKARKKAEAAAQEAPVQNNNSVLKVETNPGSQPKSEKKSEDSIEAANKTKATPKTPNSKKGTKHIRIKTKDLKKRFKKNGGKKGKGGK